jgi:thiamine-monophosphate kinase
MGRESDRLRTILSLLAQSPMAPASGHRATVGVAEMDDCAVIPLTADLDLVVGSDFVRGTGFFLFQEGVLGFADIGFYLVAANVSDLAAMGASPTGIAVVVRYTPSMTDEQFAAVMEGVVLACRELETPLLGGDTGGYEANVLSAAAFGVCPRGRALLRSGGREGDALFLTGMVGRAAAANAYFTRARRAGTRFEPDAEAALALSWRRVAPAVRQGQALVREGLSRCAIDTSDGLKASARLVAEASRLDAVLFAESIPVDPLATRVAEILGIDPLALSVGDSVDFRLLFSVPAELVERARDLFRERGWDLFRVGELRKTAGSPGAWLEKEGRLLEIPGVEWAQSEVPSIDLLMRDSPPG